MLVAMMSRQPKGGIRARYEELVLKMAEAEWEKERSRPGVVWMDMDFRSALHHRHEWQIAEVYINQAQHDLAKYHSNYDVTGDFRSALHPAVQGFFDEHVGKYGHGSIKEMTGLPTVFIEGISWWAAYLTFDDPQVRGQEMSTRAVWRHDWPMACDVDEATLRYNKDDGETLHEMGLWMTRAEIDAWKKELRATCPACHGSPGGRQATFGGVTWAACPECKGSGRKYPWMKDPEGFRPAFDRARWLLPGSIAVGVAHCADVRVMGRVLQRMELVARQSNHQPALDLVEEIKNCYRMAVPGMAELWLREAVSTDEDKALQGRVPERIAMYKWAIVGENLYENTIVDVNFMHADEERLWFLTEFSDDVKPSGPRRKQGEYLPEDWADRFGITVETFFSCSLACARDWHRHRMMMPWKIQPHCPEDESTGYPRLRPHPDYKPVQPEGYLAEQAERYYEFASNLYFTHIKNGNLWAAATCMPLGTDVVMSGRGSLKSALYMMELRAFARGGNFEYRKAAKQMLGKLAKGLGNRAAAHLDIKADRDDE